MTVDVVRLAAVWCGMGPDGEPLSLDHEDACQQRLFRTYGPAGSLWCPEHGHLLDVFPSPPLTGVVHLNYGGGRGEFVRLEDL